MDEKGDVDIDIEAPGIPRKPLQIPNLPKNLTIEEKKYLLAVERGDMANVRRMIQKAYRKKNIDINCADSLGRGSLTLAIEGENLEMVELLVILGVETKDALLHAISQEFVEAVELLLEHEELIHKEGELYSWQKVELSTGTFAPEITPLILAAHKDNYEIIKILLDRGATLPMPHDIKCGCDECIRESNEDSLRFSLSRVNEYRALASPSLIALSSNDPLLTAFQLSWELRNLAFTEQECKSDYLSLRYQCQRFAVDLLDQSRSSQELAIILNHDPDNPPYEEGEHMKLTRLVLAIDYKQKKFVAHPNIQQLLATLWYEGVPGFRRKTATQKVMIISRVALFFPFYCTLYMIAPNTATGKIMRKPFMKFLIHASSYLFFLFILILVSLRAEVVLIELFGTEYMRRNLEEQLMKQRGNGPSMLELLVAVYVLGFIWEETHEIYVEGIRSYLRNMWNFIDFTRNFLYCAVFLLRIAAFLQQTNEINKDPSTAYIPRENWDAFDPQLIAEGLFAAANIFSALKLVHLFSINPHLGPLQISLGRMVIDIVKFFFIYSLVLFAFACGLNQLLWYFADLERKKCYTLPGGLPDWDNAGDSCMKWRSFGNVFEASQSLFWASFGMVGLENFELAGIKSYTRFWGLLMFGSYSVINVIVLLNLLIAMMSNSYAIIDEHSDVEWKFARTRLWMSYFEESATLPPPFNIFPTPKLFMKLLGIRKKDKLRRMSTKRRNREEKERDYRYTSVMRALVWRYVSMMHRKCEEDPVTEDDINEVKGDISAFRYELLEVLERNGMDVSSADRKEKALVGKRMKIWERRLMKDFHVAPVAGEDEMDQLISQPPPENEDSLAKFRRIAKLAVLNSSSHKWGQVVQGLCESSQIGRCNNREAFRNQQYLQRAMEEARKLVQKSPLPDSSRSASPIEMPDTTGSTLKELLKDIKQDVDDVSGASLGSSSNLLLQTSTGRPITPTSVLSQIQKAPSLTPQPPKSVKSMDASISLPNKPQLSEKKISPPSRPQSPTPPSKPQSPENITSPEGIMTPPSKPDTPEDLTRPASKPQTPDIEITDTDEEKIVLSTPALVIEPATPVKSRPRSPEPAIKAPEDSIDSKEVGLQDKIEETSETPSKITDDTPSKVTKRRAPTPGSTGSDIAISRPVPSEKPPDQGMLPPPPSKSKPPAPQPSQELKLSSATPASDETKPKLEKVQEVKVSTADESENAAIAVSGDLISMPSTEKLIPKDEKPPVPVRSARKVEDVKPVRRQPKTGWL